MGFKKDVTGIGTVIIIVAIIVFTIYGFYWAIKSTSYNLFYEDMVKQTVIEMVKEDALQ